MRGIGSEQDGAVLPKQPVEEGPRRPRHEVKPAEGRSGRSSGPSGHKQPSAQWRRQLMRSTFRSFSFEIWRVWQQRSRHEDISRFDWPLGSVQGKFQMPVAVGDCWYKHLAGGLVPQDHLSQADFLKRETVNCIFQRKYGFHDASGHHDLACFQAHAARSQLGGKPSD